MCGTGDGGGPETGAGGIAGEMPRYLRAAPGGRPQPRRNCHPDGPGRANGSFVYGASVGTRTSSTRRGLGRPGCGTMKYTEQERFEAAEWFIDIHDAEDPSPYLLRDWMRCMEA